MIAVFVPTEDKVDRYDTAERHVHMTTGVSFLVYNEITIESVEIFFLLFNRLFLILKYNCEIYRPTCFISIEQGFRVIVFNQ